MERDARGAAARAQKSQRRARALSRDRINAAGSRVRSYVEHPFQVVKGLWCFTKVRYRGLLKNTTRAYATLALANLYRLRHRLMLQGT